MTINLDLIDYDNFNFKIVSNKAIQNIETDENIELTNESNEEVSFDFNKLNSNLKQITLRYEISDNLNVDDTITFKATVSDNSNEESELLELEYEVKIINNNPKETDDTKQINNQNNSNNEDIETIDSNNKTENNNTYSIKNVSNSSTNNEQVVTYNGSGNNYLKSLSIPNYDLSSEFSKDRLTYFVEVGSDITSLKISATAEKSSSVVSITGNSELKDGLNKILITVTAENGNTKTYRIYVSKEN
jgi:hypothetical protein